MLMIDGRFLDQYLASTYKSVYSWTFIRNTTGYIYLNHPRGRWTVDSGQCILDTTAQPPTLEFIGPGDYSRRIETVNGALTQLQNLRRRYRLSIGFSLR